MKLPKAVQKWGDSYSVDFSQIDGKRSREAAYSWIKKFAAKGGVYSTNEGPNGIDPWNISLTKNPEKDDEGEIFDRLVDDGWLEELGNILLQDEYDD